MDIMQEAWPWHISGFLIAMVMFTLLLMGRTFGVSSTLRTLCAIGGAGRKYSFFNFNWKAERWNLVFVLGSLVGGIIASTWLMNPEPIALSNETISELNALGVSTNTHHLAPLELFSWSAFSKLSGWIMIVLGGFLVGFGTRYAGGCTSGHAITGLSNLQLPSLIAVIGFFIGGLIMTHLLLPIILKL